MSDKEMLNYAKAYRALTKTKAEISNDSEDQKRFEIIDWLIKQAEHKQKLLERLNKRGIEIRKLKNQLSRCRGKIKKLDWNLFVAKGTADQAMRANSSNYELANKLEEENKRLREALEFYADKEIYKPVLISEAQCIDGNWVEPVSYKPPTIYLDKGEIARKVLKKII